MLTHDSSPKGRAKKEGFRHSNGTLFQKCPVLLCFSGFPWKVANKRNCYFYLPKIVESWHICYNVCVGCDARLPSPLPFGFGPPRRSRIKTTHPPGWSFLFRVSQTFWTGSSKSRSTCIIYSVGATLGRPKILPKQNLSPQDENTVIFLGEIRKSPIFGGRAMLAPTAF